MFSAAIKSSITTTAVGEKIGKQNSMMTFSPIMKMFICTVLLSTIVCEKEIMVKAANLVTGDAESSEDTPRTEAAVILDELDEEARLSENSLSVGWLTRLRRLLPGVVCDRRRVSRPVSSRRASLLLAMPVYLEERAREEPELPSDARPDEIRRSEQPTRLPGMGALAVAGRNKTLCRFRQNRTSCDDEKICVICQQEFADDPEKPIATLKCKCGDHNFHEECINRWFERSNTCPFCRAQTTTNNSAQRTTSNSAQRTTNNRAQRTTNNSAQRTTNNRAQTTTNNNLSCFQQIYVRLPLCWSLICIFPIAVLLLNTYGCINTFQ